MINGFPSESIKLGGRLREGFPIILHFILLDVWAKRMIKSVKIFEYVENIIFFLNECQEKIVHKVLIDQMMGGRTR